MFSLFINEIVIISCFFFAIFFASISIAGIIVMMYESIENKYRKWFFEEMTSRGNHPAYVNHLVLHKDQYLQSDNLVKHENGYDH